MSQEGTNELFDRHYFGLLSESEQLEFEEKLKTDSAFKNEYSAYLRSIEAINLVGFRNDLDKIIHSGAQPATIFNRTKIFLSVAASLALISLVLFIWNKPSPYSVISLAQAYYKPYPNIIASRGVVSELGNALGLYSKGNYSGALELLNQLTPSDTTLFYKGLCQLSLNKADSALYLFNQLKPTSIFYPQANWYCALAFLQKNNPRSAVDRLHQIKQGQFRHSESLEVLEKMQE